MYRRCSVIFRGALLETLFASAKRLLGTTNLLTAKGPQCSSLGKIRYETHVATSRGEEKNKKQKGPKDQNHEKISQEDMLLAGALTEALSRQNKSFIPGNDSARLAQQAWCSRATQRHGASLRPRLDRIHAFSNHCATRPAPGSRGPGHRLTHIEEDSR